ncbi:hypothetical protein [Nonomuraea typhae]|uniref:Uncharacterized protein n=1 Tax=Nonomuraea typhae TaxID=2603600 RepID=A0ABW7YNE0_9ACTN
MTEHANLAASLAEPADQTVVIVGSDYDDLRIWERNDHEAAKGLACGAREEARWFEKGDLNEEPLTWGTVLHCATHVWLRGPLLASQQPGEASR